MEKAQNVADLDDLARVPDHFGGNSRRHGAADCVASQLSVSRVFPTNSLLRARFFRLGF
jgi:hypothetical protein